MVEIIELLKFLGVILAVIIPLHIIIYFWHRHNIRQASKRWTVGEINRWIEDIQKGFLPWDEQMMSDFIEMRNYKLKQHGQENQSE